VHKIVYLPIAEHDLTEALDYLVSALDAPKAAADLLDEFDQTVRQIARFPYACELYRTDRPMKDEIRKVPVKNYVLYYAVFPEYVEIRRLAGATAAGALIDFSKASDTRYPRLSLYVSHPTRFSSSIIPKQNRSHHSNVISDGSPSRMRMVRRISWGITPGPDRRCGARSQLLSWFSSCVPPQCFTAFLISFLSYYPQDLEGYSNSGLVFSGKEPLRKSLPASALESVLRGQMSHLHRGFFLPNETNFCRHTCVYGRKIERSMAGIGLPRRRSEVVNAGHPETTCQQLLNQVYKILPQTDNRISRGRAYAGRNAQGIPCRDWDHPCMGKTMEREGNTGASPRSTDL